MGDFNDIVADEILTCLSITKICFFNTIYKNAINSVIVDIEK